MHPAEAGRHVTRVASHVPNKPAQCRDAPSEVIHEVYQRQQDASYYSYYLLVILLNKYNYFW